MLNINDQCCADLIVDEYGQIVRNLNNRPSGSASYPPHTPFNGRRRTHKLWLYILVSIVVLVLLYKSVYQPYITDRDAPRYYTFTNLNLRSSEVGDVEYNLLGVLPYGSKLITYSVGEEWASVKADGKKGYVSSSLILSSEDFHLLNSAWGNTDAKECVPTAKCRLAILDYYKRSNLKGGVEWQIYTKKKEDKPNTVFYPRIFDRNSKFTDFVFLVKSNQTQKRMFVIYSFDDETETPVYRYDMQAPEEGYIKNVQGYSRNSSLYLTVTYSDGKRQTATLKVAQPLQPDTQRQQTAVPVQQTSVQSSATDNSTERLSAEELNKLGDVYYEKKEYAKAIVYYKKSATKGYPEALANLGWLYYKGLGVQADGAIAISYLKDGLESGNLNAGYYLGILYENGLGNRFYDLNRALSIYKQVAFKGHIEAIKSLKRLADNGNRHACLYMGTIYREGVNEEYKDLEQAIHYYKLAAEKGESEAIKALSELNVD